MTTLLDYKTTLAYLSYLGYNEKATTALKVTRPRRHYEKASSGRKTIQRNVLVAYVFGAVGSGKTALCKALVNKPFSETYETTARPFSVVNSVEIGGVEKYLVVKG